jgi:chemotaxis protein methyltransferase WspC
VEPYDAIFCRNLLIYFDAQAQRRAIGVLQRLLRPTGVLFVGPAEANVVLNADFVSAKVPLAFAFRRAEVAPAKLRAAPVPAPRKRARPAAPSKKPAAVPARATAPRNEAAAKPALAGNADADLARAYALADEGRLKEAAAVCEAHLRERGPSAPAYYLMGLICSADGFLPAADRYYRKALYLDRNHHDALVHLALLLEQQGDEREAKVLRRRAQRLAG